MNHNHPVHVHELQAYLFLCLSLVSINFLSVTKEYSVNECLLYAELGKRLPRDLKPAANVRATS